LLFSGLACSEGQVLPRNNRVIECTVTRRECRAESNDPNTGIVCSAYEDVSPFLAKTCALPTDDANAVCVQKFCDQPAGVPYGYQNCMATGTDVTSQFPDEGTCRPTQVDQTTRLALVAFTQRWRDCHLVQATYCDSLTTNSLSGSSCLDLTLVGALQSLKPSEDKRDPSVQLSSVVLNSSQCPALAGSNLNYAIAAKDIGNLSAPETNVVLTSTGGAANGRRSCSVEGCLAALDRLQVKLADRVVLGIPIKNIVVATSRPIAFFGQPDLDGGFFTLPAHGLNLVATAEVAGVPSVVAIQSNDPWKVGLAPGALHLEGPLNMVVHDAAGRPLQISGSLTVDGAPPSSCATLSPIDRLFGFEDVRDWRTTAATLSSVTSPITQGCAALGIAGQGYVPITGQVFATSAIAPQPALSVDLFVPPHQPNPNWLGALQMYLSCPSGGVSNQYIGQVELTGKPQDQFSTLRFPLPAATLSTLRRSLNDCSFTFALNVNATGRTWILDNLRFTP
jgi:hypothetical protein